MSQETVQSTRKTGRFETGFAIAGYLSSVGLVLMGGFVALAVLVPKRFVYEGEQSRFTQ